MSKPPNRRITGYQPTKAPGKYREVKNDPPEKECESPTKPMIPEQSKQSNFQVDSKEECPKPPMPVALAASSPASMKDSSQQQPNKSGDNEGTHRQANLRQTPPVGNANEDIQQPQGQSSDSDSKSEKKEDQSSADEDEFIVFESQNHFANQNLAKKTFSVDSDLGLESERTIKKVVKKFEEKRKQQIKNIDEVQISIDTFYPRIKIMYKLNDSPRDLNILFVYRGIQQHETQARNFLKKLYTDNFTLLTRDACKRLYPILLYRLKHVKRESFLAEPNEKEKGGLIKSIAAVYSLVPNETIQFTFVDYEYTQINFNNLFIEKYQERYLEAYKYYCKVFKPRLLRDAGAAIIDKSAQEVRPHLNDEEMSSDDEDKRKVVKQINYDDVKDRLTELFGEDLTFFSEKIEEKQLKFSELNQDDKNRDEDRMAILSGEISDMQDTLNHFIAARNKLKEDHDKIMTGREMLEDTEKEIRLVLIYKHLRMLRNQLQSQLPIIAKKKKLFQCLRKSDLVILEGQTGSGKSTQLPQMLCEYYDVFQNGKSKPIVLTQPRKIATRTLAERIAFQMGEELHGFVDYASSSGSKLNRNSKIIVKLDRLLLDELQLDPFLNKYSCLVIDEAHERTISIDVIIGIITNILKERKDFKVIVTSATLDAALFEKHFAAKTFKVSGRLYPVQSIYKAYPEEDTIENKIYKCLTEDILENRQSLKSMYQGHVLSFCTGVDEINRLCERMKNFLNMSNFTVLGLHGKLTAEEQKLAFLETPGKAKIIFSTRIAETAITIDKVKVVIDPGCDRESVYDQKKKISTFQVKAISRSAAKQRQGRAGRTSSGYCFKLYDKDFEKENMAANKTPQIESIPLDILVLRLKALNIRDLLNFPYLSKPNEESLKASIESMYLIGCLNKEKQITPIGKAIVRIPIEPFLSRAIIEGLIVEKSNNTKKDIVKKIIRILAIIVNNQGAFYSTEDTREISEKSKFTVFAEPSGDFFSLLNVYEAFELEFAKGREQTTSFLNKHFLSKKSLFQARDLIKQIELIVGALPLDAAQFVTYAQQARRKIQRFPDMNDLITSCLLTSFCQNLCLYSGDSFVGYTLVSSQQPLQIYGSSFLVLQGINPKWIVCYDIIKTSNTYCRIAQEVTFNMLRDSVSKAVFEKYRLGECQKVNPYYEKKEMPLPTVVLRHLQSLKFDNKEDPKMPWLQSSSFMFDRQTNLLRVVVLKSKEEDLKDLDKYVKDFAKTLKQKPLVHNFLGNITAEMTDGCSVKQLHLSENFYSVKFTNLDIQYQELLLLQYKNFCYSWEQHKSELVMTFTTEYDRDVFLTWKQQLGKAEEPIRKCKTEKVKNYIQRKNRVPTACLKLRFWVAEAKLQKNLLIIYKDPKPEQLKRTLHELQNHFSDLEFAITKKGKDINAFLNLSEIRDEYELSRALRKLERDNIVLIPHQLVIGFRELDSNESTTTERQWVKRICMLFEDEDDQLSEHAVYIRGTCQDTACKQQRQKKNFKDKKEQHRRDCDEHMTDITASITIYNSKMAENFVRKYDGQRKILGTEKMHAQVTYRQPIMRLPTQVFNIFHNKFYHEKDVLQRQYQQLELTHRPSTIFNKKYKKDEQFTYIDCFSPKRDNLLLPTIRIRQLFKSFTMILEPETIRALNRTSSYNGRTIPLHEGIFSRVELSLNYEVYIECSAMKSELKLYCCQQKTFQEAQKMLKEQLKHLKQEFKKISYRGKNVHRVQEIINSMKDKIQAEISYSLRCVLVSGISEYITEFDNKIRTLASSAKQSCPICFDILSMPMKLLNCQHTFCSSCIVTCLRTSKEDAANYPLLCPDENCKKAISIYDLRILLDIDDFNRTCDKGVQKLVDNKRYHGCFTANCEQIFDVERTLQSKNFFECPMCNLSYCMACKQNAHREMSCEAFKNNQNSKVSPEQMRKMGIRSCKKCGKGIQKNGGCNHMSCPCGAHFCWVCDRYFKFEKECYDHLAKECGGIFPDNPV